MPTAFPKPGKEFQVIPLTDAQVMNLRRIDVGAHDFVYDGVLYLNDDQSEDTSACAKPPQIVS